ncbi:hypothetical protein [Flavobacterium hercynium]|uniref:Uncharacterized protein n=1 Tax=Flavobacterium hercynium TaxID=387094 RepID=A0A226GVM9_9FLAO|nr:hypothetical protein [Flavobacterium hercynium]OXA85360.1 hypothetical protein B0A66_19855 [Flavobacterium hercynium]SMP36839.1 hypothetical protein SAMN06265346_12445 [Flavobacterium hercynium]
MKLFDKAINLFDKFIKADVDSENRAYDFYLLFGDTDENKSPWLKSNWYTIFKPYFETLLTPVDTLKETGIYVNKFKAENRLTKKDGEQFIYLSEMKLGHLKWDDKSHDKWTIENGSEEYFEHFELWTPSRTICEKRQIAPDIFISIANQRDFDTKRNVQFGCFIVVAVAKSLKIDARSVLAELSKKANIKATVVKSRRWGVPEKNGKWIFCNGIQDTFSAGIYKEQDLHSIDFNDVEFEPFWEIIYQQKV